MIFETPRGRSALLCHSWQFKLCFVWGGELVSTLTSSILQMGSYLASRPHDRIVFSPLFSIAGRLSADCFVRNPCGRRCRQTAFETCPHRRRPLHCRGGRRLGDCLVGRQLTCMANSHRPVSPCSWHFVLHASLPISHAPSRPARASRSPIGGDSGDSVRLIHSWRRACSSDLFRGGHYRYDCPRRAGSAFRFFCRLRRTDRRRGPRRSRPQLALSQ